MKWMSLTTWLKLHQNYILLIPNKCSQKMNYQYWKKVKYYIYIQLIIGHHTLSKIKHAFNLNSKDTFYNIYNKNNLLSDSVKSLM